MKHISNRMKAIIDSFTATEEQLEKPQDKQCECICHEEILTKKYAIHYPGDCPSCQPSEPKCICVKAIPGAICAVYHFGNPCPGYPTANPSCPVHGSSAIGVSISKQDKAPKRYTIEEGREIVKKIQASEPLQTWEKDLKTLLNTFEITSRNCTKQEFTSSLYGLIQSLLDSQRAEIVEVIKKKREMFFKEGTDIDYVIRIRNKFRDDLLKEIE